MDVKIVKHKKKTDQLSLQTLLSHYCWPSSLVGGGEDTVAVSRWRRNYDPVTRGNYQDGCPLSTVSRHDSDVWFNSLNVTEGTYSWVRPAWTLTQLLLVPSSCKKCPSAPSHFDNIRHLDKCSPHITYTWNWDTCPYIPSLMGGFKNYCKTTAHQWWLCRQTFWF